MTRAALLLAAALVCGRERGIEAPTAFREAGAVIAVGGGGTSEAMLARALELAGGAGARVLVIGFASAEPDAGSGSVEMWREAGAEAVGLCPDDAAAARGAVERADLLWMSGGDQVRLLDALRARGLDRALSDRHAAGAVVGGTSAGAAVLSELALTGEADLERIAAGATRAVPGLALWPGTIVDQHALARRRLNRLIAAVLDAPALVGVAIDERTAAIVRGSRFEVIGSSSVVVLDARRADVRELAAGEPSAATGVRMHVLREGMSLDLASAGEGR